MINLSVCDAAGSKVYRRGKKQHCGSMIGNECSVVNFRVTRAFRVSLHSPSHKHDSGEWAVKLT